MGRRQFLIATGMASTCALAGKKLAGHVEPVLQTDAAMAGEKGGSKGATPESGRYRNLLSPLQVRNRVLKNRIMHTRSTAQYMQESAGSYYSEVAKNAAIVTLHIGGGGGQQGQQGPPQESPSDQQAGANPAGTGQQGQQAPAMGQGGGMPGMGQQMEQQRSSSGSGETVDQIIEGIHCEGALVMGSQVNVGGNIRQGMQQASGPRISATGKIEDSIAQAKSIEDEGYDLVWVGTRHLLNREELKPVIDHMQAVRNATGLIIVSWILPLTPGLSRGSQQVDPFLPSGPYAKGPDLEEVVAMAKLLEGSADILQMKDAGHYTNHPNSFTMEKGKPWMLKFAQAVKESGANIITCPTGGFHDPALNDEWIGSGKTDMVGMATPFIADPEYVKKLHDQRREDIVPCIKCHDCHRISRTIAPFISVCSVNPKFGLAGYAGLIRPPGASKKVAVIGGGPGGMKAALVAAERGHQVTLYEKGDALGGLLRHTDHSQWKWAQKDFKDYLVRQVKKAGIDVRLKTTATPEMIKAEGYDTVLAATGAEPAVSRIPGADGKNVFNIVDAYSNKKSLGKKVVLIGAGVFGSETGISLAKDGYQVTVLTGENYLIGQEWIGPHNKENQLDIMRSHPNFSSVLEVMVKGISGGKVTYVDASGKEESVQADSVVIYAGLRPRMADAIGFKGSADQVLLLGDCTGSNGTIQKTIRNAFFVASQV
jgi:thioredoxin reductase